MPENNTQQSPTSRPPIIKQNDLTISISKLFIAIAIPLLAIATIFWLNYLNILPLSQMYPNQLGWLPHKTTPINYLSDPPLATSVPQVRDNLTMYIAEGTVKSVDTEVEGSRIIYILEIQSQDKQTTQTFRIPEEKISTNTTNEGEKSISVGDKVFMAVTIDPQKPDELVVGSAQISSPNKITLPQN